MQRKPTERTSGSNYQKRSVPLASHRDRGMEAYVCASIPERDGELRHATVGHDGYWHGASVSMTLDELEQFRDAINAVLVEAGR